MKKLSFLGLVFASALTWAGNGSKDAKFGGTFYDNLGGEPTTLNPLTSTDVYASGVQAYVLETLLSRSEDTYEYTPNLAKSYTVSKDNKFFEFELRDGVTWQDGKPLTIEDVKFSFDVVFDSKYSTAHKRPYFEGIEKAEILSPKKIRFVAKNTYFLNFSVIAGMEILPKHLYQNPSDIKKLNKVLVGTGPYILDKYETGKKITLKANPNWWGRKDSYHMGEYNFEKIVLRFINEENISLEMLKKGELDFNSLTSEAFMKKTIGKEWDAKVVKVKAENKAPKGTGFVAWNLKNPLFDQREVRVALAHLMNRELMIQKFTYNMSMPATGPWYQQNDYASPNVKPIEFSVSKAVELFKKAGWTDSDNDQILDKTINGKKLKMSFTLLSASNDFMKYLTIYKEDAKKAGVDINIKLVEWNSFVKLLDERKFEAITLAWSGAIEYDPKQIWHSTSAANGGSNFISYNNPKVDKMIDEARNIFEKEKRLPLMRKVYEEIAYDAPYAVFFNAKYVFYGHSKKLKKLKDTYTYDIGRVYWWIP
jgi:peptide/nickel transport system substrate-binding protein/microcin C transport system substrate-binding protein